MWGSDYPHDEGTYPHSREAIRSRFHELAPDVKHKILAANAAELYDFDLDALAPLADRGRPDRRRARRAAPRAPREPEPGPRPRLRRRRQRRQGPLRRHGRRRPLTSAPGHGNCGHVRRRGPWPGRYFDHSSAVRFRPTMAHASRRHTAGSNDMSTPLAKFHVPSVRPSWLNTDPPPATLFPSTGPICWRLGTSMSRVRFAASPVTSLRPGAVERDPVDDVAARRYDRSDAPQGPRVEEPDAVAGRRDGEHATVG